MRIKKQVLEIQMKYKFISILIILIALFQGPFFSASADEGLAGMPGVFLHMGVGARAYAMGQAYTALANDPTAIYWNPAALANQNPFQVYFMHSVLFFDTNFDYLAGTVPTRELGSFGAGLLFLNSGEFDQRNELNQELGSFSITDLAFFLSWSKEIFRGLSGGINYKLVNQRMLNYSGIGHGFDVGFKTRLFNRLDTGLMFLNLLSPKVKLAYDSQSYPMQVKFGVAMKFLEDKLVLSSDIAKIMGWESTYLNIGAEYTFMEKLALRAGFYNGRLTLGAGFSLSKGGIDYSHKSVSDFGSNHSFAVKYEFGGFGVSAKAIPDIFSPLGEQNISRIQLFAKARSDISEWRFEIYNQKGALIRDFFEKGRIPEQIVWDGRDNSGALVEDGKYKYRFEIWTATGENLKGDGTLVSIDTKGPTGTLGLGLESEE